MKRFYREVAVIGEPGGWQVRLDGRAVRTQGGAAQLLPTPALAEALAGEWRDQGEKIDLRAFPLRDLADYALDHVAADRAGAIAKLLAYAETDTLCYRADPDEPLYPRQQALWEPLVTRFEAARGIRLVRISGVIHRQQPAAAIAALRDWLGAFDDFTLAGLTALASLATSLAVVGAALEPGADGVGLFAAANLEEDWQAQLWGWDADARAVRAAREEAFAVAAQFVLLAGAGDQGR